jgi:hypothetical protein
MSPFFEVMAWVVADALRGSSAEPKPAAPAALIKSLLEKFLFLPDMLNFSS